MSHAWRAGTHTPKSHCGLELSGVLAGPADATFRFPIVAVFSELCFLQGYLKSIPIKRPQAPYPGPHNDLPAEPSRSSSAVHEVHPLGARGTRRGGSVQAEHESGIAFLITGGQNGSEHDRQRQASEGRSSHKP